MLLMAGMCTTVLVVFAVMVSIVGSDKPRLTGEKIGVIEIKGAIVDSQLILYQMKTFRESDAVKAIVVRIDSPGGSVGPSQEIFREIRKTVVTKKVIVSMGAVAASGGYYVAAAADGIVANPGTITGSIGVIMGFTNFEELMKKIGLAPVVIKSGEYKDTGSPARSMTGRERELLESVTQAIHQQFVNAIVEGRELPRPDVEAVADGRIITGEQALSLGLVDRLGNYEDAVAWAADLSGVTGKVETVFPEKEKAPLMEYLMSSTLKLITGGRLQSRLEPWMQME
jgi:protease-4